MEASLAGHSVVCWAALMDVMSVDALVVVRADEKVSLMADGKVAKWVDKTAVELVVWLVGLSVACSADSMVVM